VRLPAKVRQASLLGPPVDACQELCDRRQNFFPLLIGIRLVGGFRLLAEHLRHREVMGHEKQFGARRLRTTLGAKARLDSPNPFTTVSVEPADLDSMLLGEELQVEVLRESQEVADVWLGIIGNSAGYDLGCELMRATKDGGVIWEAQGTTESKS
jgi:hypothetical protein